MELELKFCVLFSYNSQKQKASFCEEIPMVITALEEIS